MSPKPVAAPAASNVEWYTVPPSSEEAQRAPPHLGRVRPGTAGGTVATAAVAPRAAADPLSLAGLAACVEEARLGGPAPSGPARPTRPSSPPSAHRLAKAMRAAPDGLPGGGRRAPPSGARRHGAGWIRPDPRDGPGTRRGGAAPARRRAGGPAAGGGLPGAGDGRVPGGRERPLRRVPLRRGPTRREAAGSRRHSAARPLGARRDRSVHLAGDRHGDVRREGGGGEPARGQRQRVGCSPGRPWRTRRPGTTSSRPTTGSARSWRAP